MHSIQYTIRNVPPVVDQAIRKRARLSGKSFNQTVVESLTQQVFGTVKPPEKPGLEWFVGAGKGLLDESFDEAIADQSKPDPELWR